ncbi:MAG TPA: ABC transporter permease, partial [Acidiferrobacterales bacterium]|nr:ABC transporter permease [Acidiferrobacterales bacterium]
LVLRYGLGAENLAWVAIFAVAPVSGIYYPVSVLPDWLRVIADLLPASHVFEGMRALLFEHTFRTDLFVRAVGLNVLYLGFGIAVFLGVFRAARRRGLLINVGE